MKIAIQNLSKSFNGMPVLYDVSYTWEDGKIHGIIGRSGAGKTTLLRCLGGIESPDKGNIFWEGDSFQRSYEKTGFVFQGYTLLTHRTVVENVLLPAKILGIPRSSLRVRAAELLARVGLSSKAKAYPSELSGGQRQRVAIARALILSPHVLLCDELTSALDPETTREILTLLRDLNQDSGVTVILITHDLGVIKEIADHVMVLEKGRIVETGRTIDLLSSPKHETTQTLVHQFYGSRLPDYWKLHETPKEGDEAVYRLDFSGNASTRPIIAELIHDLKAPINIVCGNIDHVGEHTLGHLVVSFPDRLSPLITRALDFQNVRYTNLGYVRWICSSSD